MARLDFRFVCSCVTCPGEDAGEAINAMKDTASDITRGTFLRYVPATELGPIEHGLGYEVRYPRRGLTMARDWHVSYHRSTFRGRPCVYFRWSGVEHIFQPEVPR
jgi:hypothetical protein